MSTTVTQNKGLIPPTSNQLFTNYLIITKEYYKTYQHSEVGIKFVYFLRLVVYVALKLSDQSEYVH